MFRRLFDRFKSFRPAGDPDARPVPLVRLQDYSSHPDGGIAFVDTNADDITRAIEPWTWLLPATVTVIAVSAWGDIFFVDVSGSVKQLSALDGSSAELSENLVGFSSKLYQEQFRDEWLLVGLVLGARSRGLILEPGECYFYRIPPALGGDITFENMGKLPLAAQMALASEVHRQVSRMNLGDEVSKIRVVD